MTRSTLCLKYQIIYFNKWKNLVSIFVLHVTIVFLFTIWRLTFPLSTGPSLSGPSVTTLTELRVNE